MKKWEKLKQLASSYSIFVFNDLIQDGVGSICYIHLKHHWIGVDIQSNSNAMDHYFVTTLNRNVELMQRKVKENTSWNLTMKPY
jgi:hypothetical protein